MRRPIRLVALFATCPDTDVSTRRTRPAGPVVKAWYRWAANRLAPHVAYLALSTRPPFSSGPAQPSVQAIHVFTPGGRWGSLTHICGSFKSASRAVVRLSLAITAAPCWQGSGATGSCECAPQLHGRLSKGRKNSGQRAGENGKMKKVPHFGASCFILYPLDGRHPGSNVFSLCYSVFSPQSKVSFVSNL